MSKNAFKVFINSFIPLIGSIFKRRMDDLASTCHSQAFHAQIKQKRSSKSLTITILTHLCLVDSPILQNWINLFPKLGMSSIFISIFRIFRTEIPLSKQCRPWWDATSCSVSSGSTLFAKAYFLDARHKWVRIDIKITTRVVFVKHNSPFFTFIPAHQFYPPKYHDEFRVCWSLKKKQALDKIFFLNKGFLTFFRTLADIDHICVVLVYMND